MLKPNKIHMNYDRTVVAKHPNGYWEVFYISCGTLWAVPTPLPFSTYNEVTRFIYAEYKINSIQPTAEWKEVTSGLVVCRQFYRVSNGLSIPAHEFEKELCEFRSLDQEIPTPKQEDSGASLALRFPKYWKTIPELWKAIDTYRVNVLFPIHGDDSGRLLHARKKLLVPGTRTGGKSLYIDIAEAHATLGAWLADNTPEDAIKVHIYDGADGCTICYGKGVREHGLPCPCKEGLKK